MGQTFTMYSLPHLWKEDEPYAFDPIKYDPQFGFDGNREEKKIRATKAEMDSANLEERERNFCAHITIQYRGCIKNNVPFLYKCNGLYHELADCHLEERLHDMKEFERERRLNARERRLRELSSQGGAA